MAGTTRKLPQRPEESVQELCTGITASAQRLRQKSRATRAAGDNRAVTSDACQWRATATAIAFDATSAVLRSASESARALPAVPPPLPDLLWSAAAAAGDAAWRWLHTSMSWDMLATDTRGRTSPTVPDTAHLRTRLGRLAYGPSWRPQAPRPAPARAPADLAPTQDDLRLVLDAVLDAAGSLAEAGTADLAAVAEAADSGRLRQPAFTFPAPDRPDDRWADPTAEALAALFAAYSWSITASAQAAALLASAAGYRPQISAAIAPAAADGPGKRQALPASPRVPQTAPQRATVRPVPALPAPPSTAEAPALLPRP